MKLARIISQSLSTNLTNTSQTPKFLHKTQSFSTPTSPKPNLCNGFASSSTPTSPSERVSSLVDEISGLTLLEVSDLTEILRKKMNISEVPMMGMAIHGTGFVGSAAKGGVTAAKAAEKAEKTAFDLKLEGGFEAGVKIKIIKEVRACTELGLKEAKDLVEKAPTLLKKGVTKEEAEKIIEKMKEVGAKVTME